MPMAGMPMAASSDKAAVAPEDLYGGQKSCPVTGKPLGSMGKPLAVEVNGQTIYVCCQGCVAKVKANPDFYIAKVKKETGK
jgi:YHS domain-containing protein